MSTQIQSLDELEAACDAAQYEVGEGEPVFLRFTVIGHRRGELCRVVPGIVGEIEKHIVEGEQPKTVVKCSVLKLRSFIKWQRGLQGKFEALQPQRDTFWAGIQRTSEGF